MYIDRETGTTRTLIILRVYMYIDISTEIHKMSQNNYTEATEESPMGVEDDDTRGLPQCLLLYSPLAPYDLCQPVQSACH
jgi:hypothetical protein